MEKGTMVNDNPWHKDLVLKLFAVRVALGDDKINDPLVMSFQRLVETIMSEDQAAFKQTLSGAIKHCADLADKSDDRELKNKLAMATHSLSYINTTL
jgi:hypothetical protein